MRLPANWNWKSPDYAAVYQLRIEALQRIRARVERDGPEVWDRLKDYYRSDGEGLASFISDWGTTFDPRLVERELPGEVPFVLFARQVEYVCYVYKKWREGRRGLVEKSRDCGVTWLDVGIGAGLCVLHRGVVVGHGSRTEPYVDLIGSPKAIFERGRIFMSNVPAELRAGWTLANAPFMRMDFPETGSYWTGEVGKNIGRGDRTSIEFVDEAAHLEHAEAVELSLSQTTNCRIDVSSVNGPPPNRFAINRHSGKIEVFVFDWREDPRKDEAWYRKQCDELDPVVVAQEIDRDYTASVEGIVIPGPWARACVDALDKLGIVRTGRREAAFDVADEGIDSNAWGLKHGIEIVALDEWSGKGGDLMQSTERVFGLCDEHGVRRLKYDADGMGAGVRGDARTINERRPGARIEVLPHRGSGEVADPDLPVYPGANDANPRTNRDFFLNFKAQSWWRLRERCRRTWQWVRWVETGGKEGSPCHADDVLSINSKEIGPQLTAKLVTELSQPTRSINAAGKVQVDKKPDGLKSPNLADVAVMLFAPSGPEPLPITADIIQAIRASGAARRRIR